MRGLGFIFPAIYSKLSCEIDFFFHSFVMIRWPERAIASLIPGYSTWARDKDQPARKKPLCD